MNSKILYNVLVKPLFNSKSNLTSRNADSSLLDLRTKLFRRVPTDKAHRSWVFANRLRLSLPVLLLRPRLIVGKMFSGSIPAVSSSINFRLVIFISSSFLSSSPAGGSLESDDDLSALKNYLIIKTSLMSTHLPHSFQVCLQALRQLLQHCRLFNESKTIAIDIQPFFCTSFTVLLLALANHW